jgi:hypothetical protein
MAVEGSLVDDTLLVEVSQTALTKLGIVAMRRIATELIHGDLQHEARLRFPLRG